jgi:N-acetylglucosamine-6-phosphate deacetylase
MNKTMLSGPVLLPDAQIVDATVRIEGGQIAAVTRGADPAADFTTRGVIAPGMIDLQLNGGWGHDFTSDGRTVAAVAARLPATGVTSFVPTVITSPWALYEQRLAEIAAASREARGAQVLGVHLEGPFLNPNCSGAHDPALLRPIDLAAFAGWIDHPLVRIVTLAPELPAALDAIRLLVGKDIVASAGHSDATFEQAQAGFAAGITWGTHLFNAMHELGHREPGLSGALLQAPVAVGLIADGIHIHPSVVQLAVEVKGPQQITLVTDAMAAMGMPPGSYQLAGRTVIVDEAAARLPDGTLAGSTLTMAQAVQNTVAFSGCTLAEALSMATATPANVLGLARKGRLVPGCDADLVVFDETFAVTHTFVGGQLMFEA